LPRLEIEEVARVLSLVGDTASPINLSVPFKIAKEQLVASFERRYVDALLRWAISRAARKAGIDRINLHRILQRRGLRDAHPMKD
jgi:hypothetical protein